MTENFYADMKSVNHFSDLFAEARYQLLPEDWSIVTADVENSTKAIGEGRYKEVNGLGVAFLTAVLNRVSPVRIPYVFGGDGATLCVPPRFIGSMEPVLSSVRQMAKDVYGLRLRTAVIAHTEIIKSGSRVLVAKLKLSEYCTQAVFNGGGITAAEKLLKAAGPVQEDVPAPPVEADYSGLECRWEKIPAVQGKVMALIVAASNAPDVRPNDVYRRMLLEVQKIYGNEADSHPLRENAMKLSFNPRNLSVEHGLKSYNRGVLFGVIYSLSMFLQNCLGFCFMRMGLRVGNTDWGAYRQALIRHTDVRKFDDCLRILIAGNSGQQKSLTDYLEREVRAGHLNYGCHLSAASLVTCIVRDHGGEHYHFLDGADGGYTMAALELKEKAEKDDLSAS